MSIYRCDICEQDQDADYQDCYEHPTNPCACICEECHMEIVQDNE